MNEIQQHRFNKFERYVQNGEVVPETGIGYIEEAAGPSGCHVTLFITNRTEPVTVKRTKRIIRGRLDVNGFSVVMIGDTWPMLVGLKDLIDRPKTIC